MSVTHEMRVLELQSQVEVLERLRLLTQFGSSLLVVSGSEGAGKTWLAQRYLEVWADDKNQSLLMCFPNQDDEQRRMTLLSQIDSRAFFDPALSLADNVSDVFHDEPCNIAIVVDDAQLLSETLISELWMLVLEGQNRANWSISVVLFSLPNILDNVLNRLTYGQEQKPIEIEIEPLSDDDADRFFEFYVMRYVEDGMERRVRNAYKKVNKIPGEIMALGEQKMEKRIIIRSIVGSPKMIALIVCILALGIGGGYYGAFYLDNGPANPVKEKHTLASSDIVQTEKQETVIPTLQNTNDADSATKTAVTSQNAPASPATNANDDSNALPPDVVNKTANVGEAEKDHKRVVISSDVVDQLIKDDDTHTMPAPVENTATTSSADTVKTPSSTSASSEPSILSPDALTAMPARSYTIQLGAFRSLNEVNDFIQEYGLEKSAHAYETKRNNGNWYIVTYKDYPTIQQARDAIESLPEQLKNLSPWAKSLQDVHREIERAK